MNSILNNTIIKNKNIKYLQNKQLQKKCESYVKISTQSLTLLKIDI